MTDVLMKLIDKLSADKRAMLAKLLQARPEPIAVVGIGCRFPGAGNGPDAFWNMLLNGVDTIQKVPPARWNASDFYDPDPTAVGKMNSYWGSFIDNVDCFDPAFFGISPREAAHMDPQQRLLLEVSWEALENAGYVPQNLAGSHVGVFFAVYHNDYSRSLLSNSRQISLYTSSGTAHSIAANRLSYLLDFRGPSMVVDTACSSSLVTTHMACKSLQHKECELAIAGGVSLILSPETTVSLAKLGFLSPDGRCKTFDARANGFVRGEGCGTLVLKRLSAAIADNDHIWAVIRGSAVNQDGKSNGITAPNLLAQCEVIAQALEDAEVKGTDISYIEAHGTGTPLGDPIEIEALTETLKLDMQTKTCAIGSVKTNIGHLEAAAGIAGLIKTILCLKHETIAPHLHFQKLNPNISQDNMPFTIPTTARHWPRCHKPRYAGVSSFGFGGTNAHVVLEEAPPVVATTQTDRPLHLLSLAARDSQDLLRLATRFRDFLPNCRSWPDVCYSANSGRTPFSYRMALVANNSEQARELLTHFIEGQTAAVVCGEKQTSTPLAFLFTGDGSAHANMGSALYDKSPVFRAAIDKCAQLLAPYLPNSLVSILYSPQHDQLAQHTRPALFAVEYALAQLWLSWGIKPDVVLGHEVGEYVAACIAGVFSLEDALSLLRKCLATDEHNACATYQTPRIKIISSITGKIATDDIANKNYWHTPATARLDVAWQTLHHLEVKTAIEIGAQPLLLAEARRSFPENTWLAIPSLYRRGDAWRQMVTGLGRLYVHGVQVDWHGCDREYQRHKLPLPTYPFRQKRCWFEKVISATTGAETLHPLLERRVQSPVMEQTLFVSKITGNAPAFVADHVIHDMVVFPGTGYWEMALAAATEIYGEDIFLTELHVAAPLIMENAQEYDLQVVVHPQQQNYSSFQIFSAPRQQTAPEKAQWQLHASGNICQKIDASGRHFDLEQLRQNCCEYQSAREYYRDLRKIGIKYRERFCGIDKIWRGRDQALGLLRLPTALQGEMHAYKFHPAFLDAGLQLVGCAKSGTITDAYMPTNIEKLCIYRQPAAHLWAYVTLRPGDSQDIAGGDIYIFDDNGQLVAEISGLILQRARRDSLLQTSYKHTENWLYQLRWQPQTRPPAAATNSGRRLIFADGDIGAELAALWRQSGNDCILVACAEEYCNKNGQYAVNPCRRDHFQRLFAELSIKCPIDDLVYLWSLDKRDQVHSLEATQAIVCGAVMFIVQEMVVAQWEKVPQLWLVTQHGQQVASDDMVAVAQAPLWGLGRTIALEHPSFKCVRVDLGSMPPKEAAQLLVAEIAGRDVEDQVAFRHDQRLVARLVHSNVIVQTRQPLPLEKPLQLTISQRGVIDNLYWQEVTREQPAPDEVIVNVCATGLNFRDVLSALGMYPGDPGPLGGECAGHIVAVGDNVDKLVVGDPVVAAFPLNGAFSTFARVCKQFVVPKPPKFSFAQAVTIPITFLTAHYGLNRLAKMQKGERVLIHAAAGGVGMAAVQLALAAGAEVFATAGSPRKRELVKSLGVQHVMDSRSLAFADQIMAITGGEGIDIVLNALTEEFIPKSLSLLRANGRFLELGKAEIWQPEQVATVNSLVRYYAFDLGEVCLQQLSLFAEMFGELQQLFATGTLQALPHEVFDAHNVVDAFRYMAQAKHIGKIVVTYQQRPVIDKNGSYILTGGLGGLGLKIANWLIGQGVRYLTLLELREPGAAVQQHLQELQQAGAQIQIVVADVADNEQLAKALADIEKSTHPLRGVIHAAGMLDDGVLMQQNWERFAKVMTPKVTGAWNLHNLTQKFPLDFFILFSSVASAFGSPGQSNYAAANAFLDALANYRVSRGLPALSINWGPWSETGMAAALGEEGQRRWAQQGFGMIAIDEGLQVLGRLVANAVYSRNTNEINSQIVVLPIHLQNFTGKFIDDKVMPVFYNIVHEIRQTAVMASQQSAQLLQQLQQLEQDKRLPTLTKHLQQQVAAILGLESPAAVNIGQGFFDMGMDSLTAVELKNAMQNTLGQTLPATLAFDYPNIDELSKYLLRELVIPEQETQTASPAIDAKEKSEEPIAIVGMACRFPQADNPQQFWQLLRSGTDAITEIPASRWDIDAFYDPNPDTPGKTYTRWGGFLREVDKFDAQFFGISPREATDMDPQQRLLLEVTWEALENAGQMGKELAGSSTGVFIGITTTDYSQLREGAKNWSEVTPYTGTGNSFGVASGRISYILGFKGPNLALDTACSSSLVAIHLACQSLQNCECQMAVAGGVNLLLSPLSYIYFSKIRAMSPQGCCKTFDADADGYVRGEGCGIVVLKRLAQAQADGDNILAIIRGTAINHDGASSGLTVPNGPSQQQVIRSALDDAGLTCEAIDYVEAHGTGTSLGDPIEIHALGSIFARERSVEHPLLVGSVKTNVGHLEGAAGVASIIKVILALQHQEIPPHLHLQTLNPHIPWQELPIKVATEATPWQPQHKPRIAGISSFGFSGTNAHVIVEQAPVAPVAVPTGVERPLHLLTLSAKNPHSLHNLVLEVADYIEHSSQAIADICFTANSRRMHFPFRLAVVASNDAQFAENLSIFTTEAGMPGMFYGEVAETTGSMPIAFVFSDGDSLSPNMGYGLYRSQPVFREAIDQCAEILRSHLKKPLPDIWYSQRGADMHCRTEYVHSAQFATEYALVQLWQAWGIQPQVVMGVGVGEYVAAVVSGVFSLEDALALVVKRAQVSGDTTEKAFADALSRVNYSAPRITWISSTAGNRASEELCHPQYWREQLGKRAKYAKAFALLEEESQIFVEIGHHPSLLQWGRHCCESELGIWLPSLSKHRDAWQQMLTNLARLYIHGVNIDWQGFDRTYRRQLVTLPNYPFHRQRYWLQTQERQSIDLAACAQTQLELFHPLLGQRLHSPVIDGIAFASLISHELPAFLCDHVVHGMIAFPATAYLEVAYAASKEIFATPGYLANVAIYEPLIIAKDLVYNLHTIITSQTANKAHFKIFSAAVDPQQNNDEPMNWKLHVDGTMQLPTEKQPSPTVDLEKLRLQCPKEQSTGECYRRLRNSGLEYGERFRGMSKLWQGENQALGLIQLPSVLLTERKRYQIHPALLDACLQLFVATIPRDKDDGTVYLPVSIASFRIYGQPQERLWGYVTLTTKDTNRESLLGKAQLIDEAGNVLVELGGVAIKRASREALTRITQKQHDQLLYEVAWKEQPPTTQSTPSGSWLVFAGRNKISEYVINQLQRQDCACTLVFPGTQYEQCQDHFTVDPGKPEHFQKLLRVLADDCQGVVHLWSLDVNSQPDKSAEVIEAAQLITCGSVLHLVQELMAVRAQQLPQLFLVTQNAYAVRQSSVDPTQTTLTGLSRVIAVEHPQLQCVTIDVANNDENAAVGLWQAICGTHRENQIAVRGEQLLVPRLVRSGKQTTTAQGQLSLPKHKPFQLAIKERGIIENLQATEAEMEQPGADELVIRVHVTGLNFRDVLNVLGMYPGDPGPFGGECSGTVVSVGANVKEFKPGDQVIAAFAVTGTFRSFARVHKAFVVGKPDNLNFAEAATIPVTFLTAHYGLCQLAKITAGDKVLIHAAAGGVGLAAVQIAQRAGAVIFATAGNPEKRQFLQSLGIEHVMDSRSLDFAEQISTIAGDRGIDIVLNSLAGDFIPQSMALLCDQGRFIEIGKADIWDAERVAATNSQIKYWAFDLAELCQQDPQLIHSMLGHLMAEFAQGQLQPLCHRTFAMHDVVDAFRYMAQAKHIGKIVVAQQESPPASPITIHGDATYVITGGLGSLGRQFARHLVERGARHLVLANLFASDTDRLRVQQQFADTQAQIEIVEVDIADYRQLSDAIVNIERQMPPLRGLIHAAGLLDDGVLLQQNWQRFAQVMAPKVSGTWNLHLLTRDKSLDFWVMFSSIASIFGAPGQGNYVAANAFLDAMAHYRRWLQLPALTINWGPWAGTGMAASSAGTSSVRRRDGLGEITPELGLQIFDQLLTGRFTQICAIPIQWREFAQQFADNVPPLLTELLSDRQTPSQPSREFLEQLHSLPPAQRRDALSSHVRMQVTKVLSLHAEQEFSPRQPLHEIGLDSLMAVELRNALGASVDRTLPATLLFDYPTIETLVGYLYEEIFAQDITSKEIAKAPPQPKAPPEQISSIEADVNQLSRDELTTLLENEINDLDEFLDQD